MKKPLVILAASTFIFTSACKKSDPQKRGRSRKPPKVEVSVVGIDKLEETLTLTGTVEPARIARMASPVEGPVVWCKVREGDAVKSGQLLARIGRIRGDRAESASAGQELETARIELKRIEKLVSIGAIPGSELDQGRLNVGRAEAKLARAAEKLGDYRIIAPFAGTVSKLHAFEGDFVGARYVLMEIFDPSSLLLRFAVPEKTGLHINPDIPIEVALDAYPGKVFQGEIVRMFPEIDRKTGTRTIEAKLPEDIELIPGMFARITIKGKSLPEVMILPSKAVVHLTDEKGYLFVVEKGGLVKRRHVRTGMEVGESLQIIEGVEPGDKVVVSGHGGLGAAKKVRYMMGGDKQDKSHSRKKPGGKKSRGGVKPKRADKESAADFPKPDAGKPLK